MQDGTWAGTVGLDVADGAVPEPAGDLDGVLHQVVDPAVPAVTELPERTGQRLGVNLSAGAQLR